jgi:hypothetical protein
VKTRAISELSYLMCCASPSSVRAYPPSIVSLLIRLIEDKNGETSGIFLAFFLDWYTYAVRTLPAICGLFYFRGQKKTYQDYTPGRWGVVTYQRGSDKGNPGRGSPFKWSSLSVVDSTERVREVVTPSSQRVQMVTSEPVQSHWLPMSL